MPNRRPLFVAVVVVICAMVAVMARLIAYPAPHVLPHALTLASEQSAMGESTPIARGLPLVGAAQPPAQVATILSQARAQGQARVILVSLQQQWLWAYQDGQLAFNTPVSTGRQGLETPTGIFSVLYKQRNITFYSPWPVGSPYYYTPERVNYALYFHDVGYYIHDAPWKKQFGPGSNFPQTNPDGTTENGSHGCVNVPTFAGAWLYQWAGDGTEIAIF